MTFATSRRQKKPILWALWNSRTNGRLVNALLREALEHKWVTPGSIASDVPGGVLLRNNFHIAVCQPCVEGGTVGDTLKALRASPATTKAKAKFILATDEQTLEAEGLVSGGTGGETIVCAYPDFPDHFGFFLPPIPI